jgi:glycosyltransferase involved in cell wall biosynthesis
MINILIIIFSKNEFESLINTFDKIKELHDSNCFDNLNCEVIVVDDGSDNSTQIKLQNYFDSAQISTKLKFTFKAQKQQGIARLVTEVLSESNRDYDLLLPLPGHDMFEKDSLRKILSSSAKNEITIGYRENLWNERPFLKFVSAKTLTLIYRLIIKRKIKDAHGLYVFPFHLAKNVMSSYDGHEILLLPLHYGIRNNIRIKEIPVLLTEGHFLQSKVKGRSSHPRLNHIFSTIKILFRILKQH